MQHLHKVYWPESRKPKVCLGALIQAQLGFSSGDQVSPGFRREVTQDRAGLTDGETEAHLYFAELRASAMQTENKGRSTAG